MEIKEFIMNTFLFRGTGDAERNELYDLIGSPETVTAERGQTILSPESAEEKVGFVVSGLCIVQSFKGGSRVVINEIKPGDTFGILTLFEEKRHFPTIVSAKKKTVIAFYSRSDIEKLMAASFAVTQNIIRFLTGRIRFLNNKISEFVKATATQKLAKYLCDEYKEQRIFTMNCKATSEKLGIGRASLYRAIEDLTVSGALRKDEKHFMITDFDLLERIAK